MKAKKLFAALTAAILCVVIVFSLNGCNNHASVDKNSADKSEASVSNSLEQSVSDSQTSVDHDCQNVCKECGKCKDSSCKEDVCKDKCLGHEPTQDELLVANLKKSLGEYFKSEAFIKSVSTAKTAAAWVPLSYLKYVDANYYTYDNARIFLKYLNMIDELLLKDDQGNYVISDSKWSASAAAAQGWYGITDYLYTWSICYNLYAQYCHYNGISDTHFSMYLQPISQYLQYIDQWQSNASKVYEIRWVSGSSITQSNLYYQGYNCFNSPSKNRLKDYDYEYWVQFMSIVSQATKNTNGHSEFLSAFQSFWQNYETLSGAELSAQGKMLLNKFKDCLPVVQVSFGYSVYSHLACIKANLAVECELAATDNFFLSYYEKNQDGSWKKEGGTPNWVGPSGRPIGASLYTDRKEYSVEYEKSMQGYFPFTDGWNQPLSGLINLDRLCNYYDHKLSTSANVTPQWALLTAMMHGIDMENYKKVEPLIDEEKQIFEDGSETFNVITLWRNNLAKNESGDYVISGNIDAAVAIAYIAMNSGVKAPSPIGLYDSTQAVIKL